MKHQNYFIAAILIASFFYGQTSLASGFLILEVQTCGAVEDSGNCVPGQSYNEYVKIQNNTEQTINLSGYKLQSQGSSGGNWINRTGTDGLPALTVGPNQTFIIASKDYGGSDEIYRHTARWGLSDTAGGIKFLDADENVLAEEHWIESSGLVIFHQPVAETPPETPPAVEPVEPAVSVSTDNTDNSDAVVAPEAQTPIVTPSEVETPSQPTTTNLIPPTNVGGQAVPPKAEIGHQPATNNNLIKTASAQGESVLVANSAASSPINEIKKLKNGSSVKISGVVSVPPGILGSQIFYLSGSGIQIYMFKKDFPDLKIGDTIEVAGTLSEAYGEKRIKLSSRDSIKFVSSGQAPAPHQVLAAEIGESLEGSLVTLSGEIVEIGKDKWYLADNDSSQGGSASGGKEIKILLKAGANIPFDLVKEGDKVEITGIISQYNKEYRLLPRSVDDIKILESEASANIFDSAQEQKSKGFGVKDYLFVGVPSLFLVGLIVCRKKIRNKLPKIPNSPNSPQ